ncbi:MAG: VWA domain-containing protein [Oleispira sp.]
MAKFSKIHCTTLSLILVFISGCSTNKVPDEELKQPLVKEVSLKQTRLKLAHTMAESKVMGSNVMASEMIASVVVDSEVMDSEEYQEIKANNIKKVSEEPVSTFSIDVDTAAYSNIRRVLNQGRLPDSDMVRTEELVNYFQYDYKTPNNNDRPFSVTTEIAPSPWNKKSYLLNIGIKGFDVDRSELPPANLVFLIDVSGSMSSGDKLGLVKKSFQMLTRQLDEGDKVAIVVYAGAAGMVLEPTAGNNKAAIQTALENLRAGGSTNGSAGIKLAYQLAQQSFIQGGINRVIIASDGDMNVGISNTQALIDLIKQKNKSGISLTTLGYGMGNYNSHLMEQLADAGNGNAAYIDSLGEAQKVLVEEMSSTLFTIAKDVKIQMEFSPLVSEYRLIGYENRLLNREDFNNDKVDAGDIGAGHTVTAIYEITLASDNADQIDPLRYTQPGNHSATETNELAFLKLRYKLPSNDDNNNDDNSNTSTSQLVSYPIDKSSIQANMSESSNNFKFSAAVAAFGQHLRGGDYLVDDFNYEQIIALARQGKGSDINWLRLSLPNGNSPCLQHF